MESEPELVRLAENYANFLGWDIYGAKPPADYTDLEGLRRMFIAL